MFDDDGGFLRRETACESSHDCLACDYCDGDIEFTDDIVVGHDGCVYCSDGCMYDADTDSCEYHEAMKHEREYR